MSLVMRCTACSCVPTSTVHVRTVILELYNLRPGLPHLAERRKRSDDDNKGRDDDCGRGVVPELGQVCTSSFLL